MTTDLYPQAPAIAEPFAPARPASRFIDRFGHVDWAGLRAECATAHRAAEILVCEGQDGWDDPAQIEARRVDVLAIAAHVRTSYTVDRWLERRRFRNALAILRNLDRSDLAGAGVVLTDPHWARFQADPSREYLRLDDRREAAVFALIERCQPSALRAGAAPFSDGRA